MPNKQRNQPVKFEVWLGNGGRYHKLYEYSRDAAYLTRLDTLATFFASANVIVHKVEDKEWYSASFNRNGYRWALELIPSEVVEQLVLVGINSQKIVTNRYYTKRK